MISFLHHATFQEKVALQLEKLLDNHTTGNQLTQVEHLVEMVEAQLRDAESAHAT
jgi:hypothetical protein